MSLSRHCWHWLALALTLPFLLVGCETEEYTETVGLRGEARRNPLLAAERILERLGTGAESRASVDPLPELEGAPGDLIVVTTGAIYHRDEDATARLLEWVDAGGHAIVCLDGFLDPAPREEPFVSEERDGDTHLVWREPVGALLTALDVDRAHPDEFGDEDDEVLATVDGHLIWMHYASGWLVEAEGVEAPWLDLERGNGRLVLLPSGKPFSNLALAEEENVSLLAAWTAGASRVVFSAGKEPGLWSLLRSRASEALWAGLVLLLVWLWAASARFGPVRPLPDAAVHGFTRHVGAVGRYLWRHDRGPMLVSALRKRAIARAERRLTLSADDGRTSFVQAVAERTATSNEHVYDALFNVDALRPKDLTRVVRDLVRLNRKL